MVGGLRYRGCLIYRLAYLDCLLRLSQNIASVSTLLFSPDARLGDSVQYSHFYRRNRRGKRSRHDHQPIFEITMHSKLPYLASLVLLLSSGSHAQDLSSLPSCAVRHLALTHHFLSPLTSPHPHQPVSPLSSSHPYKEKTKLIPCFALPQQSPALSAIGSTGCQASDFACLCKDNSFINAALAGAEGQCSQADLQSVYFRPTHTLSSPAPSPRSQKQRTGAMIGYRSKVA